MPNHIISKVEPIDEYHLLDLGTGLSHGGFASLEAARIMHGSVALRRGKFFVVTSGLSITTRAGKETAAADVIAEAQAVLSESELLRAMFDVGYFTPNV